MRQELRKALIFILFLHANITAFRNVSTFFLERLCLGQKSAKTGHGADANLTFGISVSFQNNTKINSLEMYSIFVKECLGGLQIGNTRYNIHIIPLNDFGEAERLEENTVTLVENYKVDFLFDSVGQSLEVAALSYTETKKKITMGGTAISAACLGKKYCYSVFTPDTLMMTSVLNALAVEGARNISIFYDETNVEFVEACSSIQSTVAVLQQNFNISIANQFVIPAPKRTPEDQNAYIASYFSNILAMFYNNQAVDVVFGCIQNCKDFIKFAKKNTFNARAMVFPNCIDTGQAQSLGSDGSYILSPTQWNEQMNFKCDITGWTAQHFADLYKELFGEEATILAANTFAGALTLGSATQTAGSLDSDAVAYELSRMEIHTFYGTIRFNSFNMNSQDMAFLQVDSSSGTNIVIPSTIATSKLMYPMPTWEYRTCIQKFGAGSCECDTCPKCHFSDYSFSLTECNVESGHRDLVYQKINRCNGGVELPASIPVECEYVHFRSNTGRLFSAFGAIGGLLGFFYALWVVVYKRNTSVVQCQPFLCALCSLFGGAGSLCVLLSLGPKSTNQCLTLVWLKNLLFTGLIGTLCVKVYRVREASPSKTARAGRYVQILKTVKKLGFIFLIDIIFLLMLTFSSNPPRAETFYVDIAHIGQIPTQICAADATLTLVLFCYKALLIMVGCVVSYQMRQIDIYFTSTLKTEADITETKEIMFATYSCGLILVILFLASSIYSPSPNNTLVLEGFGISSSCIISINSVFLPKFAKVYGWKLPAFLAAKKMVVIRPQELSNKSSVKKSDSEILGNLARKIQQQVQSNAASVDTDLEVLLEKVDQLQKDNAALNNIIKTGKCPCGAPLSLS